MTNTSKVNTANTLRKIIQNLTVFHHFYNEVYKKQN